jgi:uncharacterized protein (TIGR03083 family)
VADSQAVDADFLLRSLDDEGNALAAAAAAGLDQPVPSCPGWDVRALLDHVTRTHRWAAAVVRTGERQDYGDAGEPADDPVSTFRNGLAGLEAELAAKAPDAAVWTFGASRDGRAVWWTRRQALETAVHRWDAEAATSSPGGARPVTTDLAVEGIDEYLADFLPRVLRKPVAGIGGTFHVHCTDADGEWLIDLSAERPAPTREHAKADTAVRGPASGVYLWLWNRLDPGAAGLEAFGRDSVLEAWPAIRI